MPAALSLRQVVETCRRHGPTARPCSPSGWRRRFRPGGRTAACAAARCSRQRQTVWSPSSVVDAPALMPLSSTQIMQRTPLDETDADDHARAGDAGVRVRVVDQEAGQVVEFEERHAGVEQAGQPLARASAGHAPRNRARRFSDSASARASSARSWSTSASMSARFAAKIRLPCEDPGCERRSSEGPPSSLAGTAPASPAAAGHSPCPAGRCAGWPCRRRQARRAARS